MSSNSFISVPCLPSFSSKFFTVSSSTLILVFSPSFLSSISFLTSFMSSNSFISVPCLPSFSSKPLFSDSKSFTASSSTLILVFSSSFSSSISFLTSFMSSNSFILVPCLPSFSSKSFTVSSSALILVFSPSFSSSISFLIARMSSNSFTSSFN